MTGTAILQFPGLVSTTSGASASEITVPILPIVDEFLLNLLIDQLLTSGQEEIDQRCALMGLFLCLDRRDLLATQNLLMSTGVDVNHYLVGQSVLTKCIRDDYREGVEFFLSYGVNVNLPLDLGDLAISPLMIAICYNRIELMHVLIVYGANVNYREPREGTTPLIVASAKQNESAVEVLLSHCADPYTKNALNATAFDIAVYMGGKREVVELLEKARTRYFFQSVTNK